MERISDFFTLQNLLVLVSCTAFACSIGIFVWLTSRPTGIRPITYVKAGRVQTASHITENLLTQTMWLTGHPRQDLLEEIEYHTTHCSTCRDQYTLSINAVRLLQFRAAQFD